MLFIWFWLVAIMITAYVVLDGFDLGAGVLVIVVGKVGKFTGMSLNQHLMAGFRERAHTCRSDTDACFIVFNLFGNADDHGQLLFSGDCSWAAHKSN